MCLTLTWRIPGRAKTSKAQQSPSTPLRSVRPVSSRQPASSSKQVASSDSTHLPFTQRKIALDFLNQRLWAHVPSRP